MYSAYHKCAYDYMYNIISCACTMFTVYNSSCNIVR